MINIVLNKNLIIVQITIGIELYSVKFKISIIDVINQIEMFGISNYINKFISEVIKQLKSENVNWDLTEERYIELYIRFKNIFESVIAPEPIISDKRISLKNFIKLK